MKKPMPAIKVLIVEDEMIIADSIATALEKEGYEVLEPAITFTEAIERIKEHKPDIGIFDIQLSGKKNGIDLAGEVQANYNFPFIYLTSNSDNHTINKAKQTEPSGFLVKPFNTDELYAVIELSLHNYARQRKKNNAKLNQLIKDSLFIKVKDGYTRIKLDDIIYLKSENVYIDIRTINDKRYTVRATLSDYENKLNSNFFRIHRSYIVNLMYLKKFNNHNLTLNNENIPIGNKYKDELILMLKK